MNDARRTPDTVGWYIELTKWLIGIAAGVLVFGFDKLTPAELGPWPYRAFVSSLVLLVVAIGSGIFSTMQLLGYANRRESGPGANEKEADVVGYRTRGTAAYQLCAGALALGLVAFTITWGATWLSNDGAGSGTPTPVVVSVPGTTNGLVLRPATNDRPAEVLVRSADGGLAWAPLPAAPTSSVSGPAPTGQDAPPAATEAVAPSAATH